MSKIEIPNEIKYPEARARLRYIIDSVCDTGTPVIITRQSGDPVVLIPLSEYNSLVETAYILKSKANVNPLKNTITQLKPFTNL